MIRKIRDWWNCRERMAKLRKMPTEDIVTLFHYIGHLPGVGDELLEELGRRPDFSNAMVDGLMKDAK